MPPKGRKRPGKTISVKNISQKGDIYGRNRRKAYENLSKKYYYD